MEVSDSLSGKGNPLSSWISLKKTIQSGANGVTYLADIADVPNAVVIKVNSDEDESDDLRMEYNVQRYLNYLRFSCPNFALAYAIFQCPLIGNISDYVWNKQLQVIETKEASVTKVLSGKGTWDEYAILPIDTAPFCTKDVWLEEQLIKAGFPVNIPDVNYMAIELVSTTPTTTSTLRDAIINNALVIPDGSNVVTETLAVLMQICLGLQDAQDKFKFAHNDLHLNNILVQGLDPLIKAMSDLGLSFPSQSGVNVYYPAFKMTVYTANIPVIIDFGKSRLEVSERLHNAMESNSETHLPPSTTHRRVNRR